MAGRVQFARLDGLDWLLDPTVHVTPNGRVGELFPMLRLLKLWLLLVLLDDFIALCRGAELTRENAPTSSWELAL